jgi:COMPASS component SDC1
MKSVFFSLFLLSANITNHNIHNIHERQQTTEMSSEPPQEQPLAPHHSPESLAATILKKEETVTAPASALSTPAPESLQFQIPNSVDLKPSEIIGGAPVRQWLNEHVTPTLIQGVRLISKDQPQDPLRVLGEFLIEESNKKAATATATSTTTE